LAAKPAWTNPDGTVIDSTNWNALASGEGNNYAYGLNVANNPAFALGTTVTLYAKWNEITISLSVSGEGTINIGSLIPGGGAGSFGFGKAVATVETNNPSGWDLSFTASNSNMTCVTNAAVIPSIETEQELTDNSWGYGVFQTDPSSASVFKPISASTSNYINDSAGPTPTGGVVSNLYFAAKAGMSTTACSYTNTVTISAVAKL
jgi:hypothetical protein